jgi:hypothetical protein
VVMGVAVVMALVLVSFRCLIVMFAMIALAAMSAMSAMTVSSSTVS